METKSNIPLELIDKIRNLSDAEYRNLYTRLDGGDTNTAHDCECKSGAAGAHIIYVRDPE